MSVLHHESLLETCFEDAWEEFRTHNKLTVEQMQELCSISEGTNLALEKSARRIFQDLCQ